MFNYNEGRTMVLNIYTFILIFLCGAFVIGGLFFSKKENLVEIAETIEKPRVRVMRILSRSMGILNLKIWGLWFGDW